MKMDHESVFLAYSGRQLPTIRRAPQLLIDQWTKHRDIIKHLYCDQDKTLNEVIDTMKQEYGFQATSRQYTQKLKSWHLQKNVRRSFERKPRCNTSTYTSPTCVGHVRPSPKPLKSSPDEGTARTSPNDERSNQHCMGVEDPILTNQGLGMVSAWENYSTADGPGEATRLDSDTTSLIITLDDYRRFLASSIPTNRRESILAGNPLATPANASNYFSTLEESKRPISLVLAIWALWHSQDRSRFDYLSDAVESHHSHEVDITHLLSTGLDLGDWLALYPRHATLEVQPHSRLLYARPETPFLTWKAYGQYGYTVASKRSRTRMTPAQNEQNESFLSLSVRRLVSSMLLSQDGSSNLRQCFSLSLNLLQPILEYQLYTYRIPCSRIAKHPSFSPYACHEYCHQDSVAAILSMVCGPGFKTPNVYFKSMEYHSKLGAQHSMEQVLVWSCRLMLYYADPVLQDSLLPSDLCARALDGCKRVLEMVGFPLHQNSHVLKNMTGKPSFSESLQDSIFANLWAEWICRDSDFFLDDSPTESINGKKSTRQATN